jgi:hypothetical protein
LSARDSRSTASGNCSSNLITRRFAMKFTNQIGIYEQNTAITAAARTKWLM